jgi:putative endonuclease
VDKHPTVYILANFTNTTIYVGVTGDLQKRVWQHKHKVVDGFTKKYQVNKLVWYETHDDMTSAILREKQLKKWSRPKKNDLINTLNPTWTELYQGL